MTRSIGYTSEFIDGKVLICESTGERLHTDDPRAMFDFLLEPFEDSIKVVWNLDQFLARILSYLPIEFCEKLLNGKSVSIDMTRNGKLILNK